jgi:hypothetical protein
MEAERIVRSKPPLKVFDFVVLLLSLAVTIFSSLVVYAAPQAEARVILCGSGRVWVFPLTAEEKVPVPGPAGETVVEISGGRARVLSSPCTNQICVAAGYIHRPGELAACLPNKVSVTIEGNEDDSEAPDAAAW